MVFRRLNKVSGKCLVDYYVELKARKDKKGY